MPVTRTRNADYLLHIPPTSVSNASWFEFINDEELTNTSYASYYLGKKHDTYSQEQLTFVLNELLKDLFEDNIFIKQKIRASLTEKEKASITSFIANHKISTQQALKINKYAIIMEDKNNKPLFSTHVIANRELTEAEIFAGLLNAKMGNEKNDTLIQIVFYLLKRAVVIIKP